MMESDLLFHVVNKIGKAAFNQTMHIFKSPAKWQVRIEV